MSRDGWLMSTAQMTDCEFLAPVTRVIFGINDFRKARPRVFEFQYELHNKTKNKTLDFKFPLTQKHKRLFLHFLVHSKFALGLGLFRDVWISFQPNFLSFFLKCIAVKIRIMAGEIEHTTSLLRPSNGILSLDPSDVREWLAERKVIFLCFTWPGRIL
jgi:hypothetical protein